MAASLTWRSPKREYRASLRADSRPRLGSIGDPCKYQLEITEVYETLESHIHVYIYICIWDVSGIQALTFVSIQGGVGSFRVEIKQA